MVVSYVFDIFVNDEKVGLGFSMTPKGAVENWLINHGYDVPELETLHESKEINAYRGGHRFNKADRDEFCAIQL